MAKASKKKSPTEALFFIQNGYLCTAMKKLIIFDLDGTLLNTIDDLAMATNHALAENGHPTHAVEAYNLFVGNGINKLFERALPEEARTPENVQRIRASFIPFYDAHKLDLTRPYGLYSALNSGSRETADSVKKTANLHQSFPSNQLNMAFWIASGFVL